MSRPLAPCGTPAAYRRHKRRGETPDPACQEAMRAFDRAAYRRDHCPREPAPCGTATAARRHWRLREPLDEACLEAARRDTARRQGWRAGSQTPDTREKRNGLPEFVPYVYMGTGTDQYEHLYTGRYARLRDDEEEACA